MGKGTGMVTRSSGNAFADLGAPGTEERQTKVGLALAINRILDERRLSQGMRPGVWESGGADVCDGVSWGTARVTIEVCRITRLSSTRVRRAAFGAGFRRCLVVIPKARLSTS